MGDAVDVRRSDGSWQKATIQDVNLVTRTYQVIFSINGTSKGKSVPFDMAFHMLKSGICFRSTSKKKEKLPMPTTNPKGNPLRGNGDSATQQHFFFSKWLLAELPPPPPRGFVEIPPPPHCPLWASVDEGFLWPCFTYVFLAPLIFPSPGP